MLDKNTLLLAPLADITGPEFRALVEDYGGCDLYFTEMLSSGALVRGSRFEYYYRDFSPVPKKTVAQLVSHDGRLLRESAEAVLEIQPDLYGIDINMGCSAPLIYKKGGGVSWMNRIPEITPLISDIRKIAGERTVSAKIRLGFEKDAAHLSMVVKALSEGGADFITIHGRSKSEKFKRRSDWSFITAVKQNASIPVIGNGDIRSYEGYERCRDSYPVSGVMIGRKAAAAPWFFSYIRERSKGNGIPAAFDMRTCLDNYIRLSYEHVPAELRLRRFKRFCLYFSENLFWNHSFTVKISNSKDFEKAADTAREYFIRHPEECEKTEG